MTECAAKPRGSKPISDSIKVEMKRFTKFLFEFTEIILFSICILCSFFLFTGCRKEKTNLQNEIKTASEWNEAIERSYDLLTAENTNYILETKFGKTKSYTVSGNRCSIRDERGENFYQFADDKFYWFYYDKGYVRKEMENNLQTIGTFVLEDVISESNLEDFHSLKDCFQFFSFDGKGVYALNGNSEKLFAQKVFGDENGGKTEDLDVFVSFEKGLVQRIVFTTGKGKNQKSDRLTIYWKYRTVTLPTFREFEGSF